MGTTDEMETETENNPNIESLIRAFSDEPKDYARFEMFCDELQKQDSATRKLLSE
jgi:hypothetical protein